MRLLFFFVLIWPSICFAQETAESLFKHFQQALFQIQIIENQSDNKSAIGSGFAIDSQNLGWQQNGLVVTNYHVISDFIYYPDKYRIEYEDNQGNKGPLNLINFDVINDLALLQLATKKGEPVSLPLASGMPEQGSVIYSLGNPRDLGMSVVPGTFNGIKKTSFYKRVHVTSAINPGMSGGPAVDASGKVIGINVATGGNQIGFLVPLPKLKSLLQKSIALTLEPTQYKAHIQQQLIQNQAELIQRFTVKAWPQTSLGRAIIPAKITDFLSCWGDSNDKKEDTKFLSIQNRCRTGESIYISRNLRTGNIEIEFEWISTDQLETHRFYHLMSKTTSSARPGNRAGKDDVTNFVCQHEKVRGYGRVNNKAVLCIRGYKDFEQLYDALYIAVSLDYGQQSLISHFTLAGMTQESITAFSKQFMESVAWQ